MARNKNARLMCAAAVSAAALLAACHDGTTSSVAPPAPGTTNENFSTFATATFKAEANSLPVNFDKLTLVDDVSDDPTAFDGLLM